MNKLMKYCGKCEEGFAERFAYCPGCGGELQAFEMSPVANPTAAPNTNNDASDIAPPEAPAILAADKPGEVLEIPEFETVYTKNTVENSPVYSLPLEEEKIEATPAQPEPIPAAVPVAAAAAAGASANTSKSGWQEVKSVSKGDDGGFHITMVDNRTFLNDPRLRLAGLGAIVLVLAVMTSAFVYDMFQQSVSVVGPGEEDFGFAYIPVDADATIEEILEKIKEKEDNDAGGGGGGGGRDKEPPKKGDPPAMSKTEPQFKPSTHDRSVTDPVLRMDPAVWAPIDRAATGKVGAPKGGDKISDGMGGGGIGNDGTGGVGDRGRDGYGADGDRGIGYRPGSGAGPGTGPGVDGDGEPPPVLSKGPTTNVRIISQPKPPYTEEARKNQINGTVVLRVIFNKDGTIGGITTVRGLGFGLTEQAIAAARRITFEPAKRGGVPYTVTKPMQFTFTLY